MKCRLCGKAAYEIEGWLGRVNEKGVDGVFECKPHCGAKMSQSDSLLGAMGVSNPKVFNKYTHTFDKEHDVYIGRPSK